MRHAAPRSLATVALLFAALCSSSGAFAQAGVCRGDASPCSAFSFQALWNNCMKQQGCRLQSDDSYPYTTRCVGSAKSCSSFGEDLAACGKQYGCYWFQRVGEAEVD